MLAMGRALMSKPSLIVMDEPSMGLSPLYVNEIFKLIEDIHNSGTTVLLIEHDMKLVSGICEYLTVLNFGTELVSGTPSEVLNDHRVITAYLGE